MIKEFKHLSSKETDLLIKAPAIVSLLAISRDGEISKTEKADAIKLAHLRTFTADVSLVPYYEEVEKSFKKNFREGVAKYSPFNENKREQLKKEISELNKVIGKLDRDFAVSLHASLRSYAEHVKKSNRSILENFLFPFPIPGLTD